MVHDILITIDVNTTQYKVPVNFLKLSEENQKQLVAWLELMSAKTPRNQSKEIQFSKNFCNKMLHSAQKWSALLYSTEEIL